MLQSNPSELDEITPSHYPDTEFQALGDDREDDDNFGNLDELDEIFGATSGPEDFDLDALLAESVAAKAEADQTKVNRKLLTSKHLKLSAAERAKLQEQVRQTELRTEWTAQASVAIFHIQQCSYCGARHTHFAGLFQRQAHRHSRIDRWVKSNPMQNEGLPKEQKEDVHYSEMCGCCGPEFGFLSVGGMV